MVGEMSVASTRPPGPARRAAARVWPPAPAATSRTREPSVTPARSSISSVAGPSQASSVVAQRCQASAASSHCAREEAAEAWHRWATTLEAWLGPATELMLDLAGVTDGSRVLDVAAGAGGQTLAAARRAGPGGRVLATDIS